MRGCYNRIWLVRLRRIKRTMIKGDITFESREDAIEFITSLIDTFDITREELDV